MMVMADIVKVIVVVTMVVVGMGHFNSSSH